MWSCPHNAIERHSGIEQHGEPAISRTRTAPMCATIRADLGDRDSVASFLETVGKIVRSRARVEITVRVVEPPD